ncbi:hypothetical protein HMPREF0969_02834 [Bacteroides sp. D20]|nr:hypothetical protein HMPREF0969_02834 [Bacteroides sp. D20]
MQWQCIIPSPYYERRCHPASLSIINLQRHSFQVFQSKRSTSKKGLQIIDL